MISLSCEAEYENGEIELTVSAQNESSEAIELSTPSSQKFDLKVFNDDGELLWEPTVEQIQSVEHKELVPDESIERTFHIRTPEAERNYRKETLYEDSEKSPEIVTDFQTIDEQPAEANFVVFPAVSEDNFDSCIVEVDFLGTNNDPETFQLVDVLGD